MSDFRSAPSVVVGIDGSRAATHAALWAIDEAVSRDIPLRLVYVIDSRDARSTHNPDVAYAAARAALFDANGAVYATGKPVKIESEILSGRPLTKLLGESRWAAMVCVGSIGRNHTLRGQGSVATTLAGSALCPVAVIQRPLNGPATPEVTGVVVQADNGSVLRHAFEQARMRGVGLRAISLHTPETPDGVGDGKRLAQAQLSRQLAPWTRRYPDVPVESAVIRGSVERYLATDAQAGQLFVTDASTADSLCGTYSAKSSILTVRCGNL
jgi:nucleotide-binding universal stress UspA family protein